jgi:hypothetical protein
MSAGQSMLRNLGENAIGTGIFRQFASRLAASMAVA